MYASTLEFTEVPYERFGPWKNSWGYITEIACFSEDDIIIKSLTPYDDELFIRYCDSWEECDYYIMLIEADRRF